MRVAVAVIVGYLVWSVLWLGGNTLLFDEAAQVVAAGKTFSDAGGLSGLIALSMVCSLAAGASAAALAKKRHRPAVLVMSGLLLATGAAVQYDIGALMPIWYHLTFLALIVPVCVVGGAIITR